MSDYQKELLERLFLYGALSNDNAYYAIEGFVNVIEAYGEEKAKENKNFIPVVEAFLKVVEE